MVQSKTPQNLINYKKDEYIFREGDVGHELYIIKNGGVDVLKSIGDDEILLAKLGKNDFFGEMALLGNTKRSASIKANQDSELLIVNEKLFKAQFSKVPEWFAGMFKVLVERLRKMDEKIVSKFKIGIEFSMLSILFLVAEKYGTEHNGKGKIIKLDLLEEKLNHILGIPKKEIDKKLKDFQFIHILKYSDTKQEIIIPDWERLEKFIDFIKVASQEGADKVKERLSEMGDEMINYFTQLYKLISRKKGDSIVVQS